MSKANDGNSVRRAKPVQSPRGHHFDVLRFVGGFRNPPGEAEKLIAILSGRAMSPANS